MEQLAGRVIGAGGLCAGDGAVKLRAVREVEIPGAGVAGRDFLVVAGPCMLESLELGLQVAEGARDICRRLGVAYVFKASFDKANRTSADSPRGPGIEVGLEWLGEIKRRVGVAVLTDIHESWQADSAAEVADVLQVPAFLCRQTDLIQAAARTGRAVNIKKGQFMAPEDMCRAAEKAVAAGGGKVMLTERGTCFGYRDLVVDLRGLAVMRACGWPVLFDATHSVQQPGAAGGKSGGLREFVPMLVRAAVAGGCDGLYLEVHPRPDEALSDAGSQLPLGWLEAVVEQALEVREAVERAPEIDFDVTAGGEA